MTAVVSTVDESAVSPQRNAPECCGAMPSIQVKCCTVANTRFHACCSCAPLASVTVISTRTVCRFLAVSWKIIHYQVMQEILTNTCTLVR